MVPFRARFNAVINDIYEIFINFKDVKTSFCTFTMLFTMICINYRSVSVGRERSAPPPKGLYLLKTRIYALVNTCRGSFQSCLKL